MATIRASLACAQCRNRHIRCDARKPICSRCQDERNECTYLKSRRGARARVNGQREAARPPSPLSLGPHTFTPASLATGPPQESESAPIVASDGSALSSTSLSSYGAPGQVLRSPSLSERTDKLLELYYDSFHKAHPCALPLQLMRQRVHDDDPDCRFLVAVLRFIGSLYSTQISSSHLEDQVKNLLVEQQTHTTGFRIQALVLYSIAVYWCNDLPRTRELLNVATDKALAVGMQLKEYATPNSDGDPIVAESFRRTWWQLYLADGLIAASNHDTSFRTSQRDINATVELPCKDTEYESGTIPIPKTLDDYDNREFILEGDADFSSLGYLVGLARSLDMILIGIPRTSEENVKAMCLNADASVNAWQSSISKSKARLVDDDGTLDEALFTAHMYVQIFTVDIHRYLSALAYDPIEAVSICSPPPPPERLAPIHQRDAHIHTARILQAIEQLTNLLTMPSPTITHTPFAICMVATTTIAHLSACKHVFSGDPGRLRVARERIRVAMGAMEAFAEIWPKGKMVLGQVKTVARELLNLGPTRSLPRAAEALEPVVATEISGPARERSPEDYQAEVTQGPAATAPAFSSFPNIGVDYEVGGPEAGDMGSAFISLPGFAFDVSSNYPLEHPGYALQT